MKPSPLIRVRLSAFSAGILVLVSTPVQAAPCPVPDDGTGTITIDVNESAEAGPPPLFELIGVAGTLASDEIDVSRWALLPIMTPAVIVEEPQVIDAFWGWIIAYGSQAPAE